MRLPQRGQTPPVALLSSAPRAAQIDRLWVPISALFELGIVLLVERNRQHDRIAVGPALDVRTRREHRGLGPPVLPHQTPQVAQAVARAEQPERTLVEHRSEEHTSELQS